MDSTDVSPLDPKVVVQFENDYITRGALITDGANQAGKGSHTPHVFKVGKLQWLTSLIYPICTKAEWDTNTPLFYQF